MIGDDTARSLAEKLFSDEDANLFAVLDGASVPGLLGKLYGLEPEYLCLYRGELTPDMAEVSPYLIRLEPDTELTDWILQKGWGQHWGIFAATYADTRAMRGHFRSLLTVYDDSGRPLLFRYYDPRVLRLFLPTCNAEELKKMFGPVENYFVEDEDASKLLRFEVVSKSLRRKRLAVD
jgi:hypothetical protein